MKIQIIGYSGSGKSTLAKTLAQKYNLPVLHLDSVHWYGDWQQRTNEQKNQIVEKFITENSGWVIDGNYKAVCPRRFTECNLLIFLNYNRFYCFKMAYKRYKFYKGTKRPDLPCTEKFDFEFIKWLLIDGRKKERRKALNKIAQNHNGTTLIFKNKKQLNNWLKALK